MPTTEQIDDFFVHPGNYDQVAPIIGRDDFTIDGYYNRKYAIANYGFAVPCLEALDVLAALSPILEIGAGLGHWATLLRARGVDIVAVDNYSTTYGSLGEDKSLPFNKTTHVLDMSAVQALKRFPGRNVLTIWPDYETPMAYNVASKLKPGTKLAYIGEGSGGCTGDDAFHTLVSGWECQYVNIPRWPAVHDCLHIYEVPE